MKQSWAMVARVAILLGLVTANSAAPARAGGDLQCFFCGSCGGDPCCPVVASDGQYWCVPDGSHRMCLVSATQC